MQGSVPLSRRLPRNSTSSPCHHLSPMLFKSALGSFVFQQPKGIFTGGCHSPQVSFPRILLSSPGLHVPVTCGPSRFPGSEASRRPPSPLPSLCAQTGMAAGCWLTLGGFRWLVRVPCQFTPLEVEGDHAFLDLWKAACVLIWCANCR